MERTEKMQAVGCLKELFSALSKGCNVLWFFKECKTVDWTKKETKSAAIGDNGCRDFCVKVLLKTCI